MQTHDMIQSAVQSALHATPGYRAFALIDHSGMPGLVKRLNNAKHSWVSLFEGSTEENAIDAAPILLPLEIETSDVRSFKVFEWISERAAFSSSLLILISPLDMTTLVHRLQPRLIASLPDNMDVMLRYFDTRIFTALLEALTQEQRVAYFSPAQKWLYFDRRGALQIAETKYAEADDFFPPLKLTADQQNALIDASEPDQIAELLENTVQQSYQSLPPDHRYDFILKHSKAAGEVGIEAIHEKSLYCALALMYGDSFSQADPWQVGLQNVKAGNYRLKDLVAQVDAQEE